MAAELEARAGARFAVLLAALRRVVDAVDGVDVAVGAGTGFTSTVALEAGCAAAGAAEAALAEAVEAAEGVTAAVAAGGFEAALERRRGVGVAMSSRGIQDGEEAGIQLPIRCPVINDSTDGEIGEHGVIGAGMPGGGTAGSEDPVAFASTDGINTDKNLAFVVFQQTQMHVIQSRNAERADQSSCHLHDFHQPAAPLGGVEVEAEGFAAGVEDDVDVFGGSGSQWSMIPTMVRSLG